VIHVQSSREFHFALEDKESACPHCKAAGFGVVCTNPAREPSRAAAGYRDALPYNTVHLARVHALGLF
jgi:hypothetical protein